jgi:hypothetical protein
LYQTLLHDASFFDLLLRIDEDRAEEAQASGCTCGGRLHQAHYRRKPRGGPQGLCRRASVRLSYCCSVEGCRRRCTPPSLRFLGRKVFFGVVVLLVPALREELKGKRLRRLLEKLPVSARTVRRWQRWWREVFAQSSEMKRWQGLSAEPIVHEALPGALLRLFAHLPSVEERVLSVLRALAQGPAVQVG